jgi:hypothetical protein
MTATTTATPTHRDPELLRQTVVVIGGSSGSDSSRACRKESTM